MRVHDNEENPGKLRLVLQKQPELRERPGMQNCSLLSPGLDPFADAIEVFNCDTTTGAFSFSNDLLRDAMVSVSDKALFFARKFLESPFRSAGLLSLKLGPQTTLPMTDVLDRRSGIPPAVTIAGDVGDAQIHTKEVGWRDRSIVGKINRAVQVELPLSVNQVGLPLDAVKASLLVLAVDNRNNGSTARQGPQAHTVHALKTKNPLVVGDGSVGLEGRAAAFVAAEALHRLANSPNGHLGGHAEPLPDLGVGQLVDRRLAKHASIETPTGRERRGFIGLLHRVKQASVLLGIREQPQLECKLHCYGVYHSAMLKVTRLKAGVSDLEGGSMNREEIIAGLNAGKRLHVDRRDCPHLPWLMEKAEAGELEADFRPVDEQYSYMIFRRAKGKEVKP